MRIFSVVMLAALAGPSAAYAQFGKPEAVAPKPQSTSASYGDWVLNCQQIKLQSGEERRACEVTQSIQVQGSKDPIAQVAFGRALKSAPLSMTVLLPVNVALDRPVRLFAEEKDGVGVDLTWRKCLPGGCFAEVAASADTLKRWRAGKRGRLELRNASGQDLALPISLTGFSVALDALPPD
ncbi:MAG: invasion associated locus B family protein [Beijerinckiaceae bacterium]|nr:invasion associated locus B family protein [Beijerinckiaceae bacterium]MDO9442127.1 invasion associated locus B family protein [Beijerinckiaceae bacterium]